jgi:hypothetical protein
MVKPDILEYDRCSYGKHHRMEEHLDGKAASTELPHEKFPK